MFPTFNPSGDVVIQEHISVWAGAWARSPDPEYYYLVSGARVPHAVTLLQDLAPTLFVS